MSWMQEYVRIKEAARILGVTPQTILKRIAEGMLPQTCRMGGSFNSPILINLADLRDMVRVGRDIAIADATGINKASDEMKFQELNTRCLNLAKALGSPDAIVKALQDVGGVDRLSDLDPDLYAKFRARLIRLANPMTGGIKGADGRFQKRVQPEPRELVQRVRPPKYEPGLWGLAPEQSRTTDWRRRKAAGQPMKRGRPPKVKVEPKYEPEPWELVQREAA